MRLIINVWAAGKLLILLDGGIFLLDTQFATLLDFWCLGRSDPWLLLL